jgi:aminopeptidase-like protein
MELREIENLLDELYPLSRDLVSDGYDAALEMIARRYKTKVNIYPSGTKCWSWTIPPKWTLRSASIADMGGRVIFDLTNTSSLFVSSYSTSVNRIMPLDELKRHLHCVPERPSCVPYTFYPYRNNFGFNLTKPEMDSLRENAYNVLIDSVFEPGNLKVGEITIAGSSAQTFVLAAHLDHPFQANDGLSGVIAGLGILDRLSQRANHYTYKLLVLPETIGSIAWLSHREDKSDIIGGLFLEMCGTPGAQPFLQKSYQANTFVDYSLTESFRDLVGGENIVEYRTLPGNDERQFNSPGVRIPMLSFARILPLEHRQSPFPLYHTSEDTPQHMSLTNVMESIELISSILLRLDADYMPVNLFSGELFLSAVDADDYIFGNHTRYMSILKILDMLDGTQLVTQISKRCGSSFEDTSLFLSLLLQKAFISKKWPAVRELNQKGERLL